MKKKKRKQEEGDALVYSTDPDTTLGSLLGGLFEDDQQESSPEPGKQTLYVSLDRKKRKGKVVTLITGFEGSEADLEELGKWLKGQCGVGGTVKEGEILLQGNHRDKVMQLLTQKGYKVKRKGG